MDAHIAMWRDALLGRGYQEKRIDFKIPWCNRKWFSIDGHDSSILQIWYGPVYTRIVHSMHGTLETPYTYGRYVSVLHPEHPKEQWRLNRYLCEYLSAEEIWKRL